MRGVSSVVRIRAGPAERGCGAAIAPQDATVGQHGRADAGSDRKQDRVPYLSRGSAGRLRQHGKLRVVAERHADAGEQIRQIDPVQERQVRHPCARRAARQTWNGDAKFGRAVLGEQGLDEGPEFMEAVRRLPAVERHRLDRISTRHARAQIGPAEVDRQRGHPFTPALTMLSTKKRCRKTKSTSGGSTASVAPAITRLVFSAPRL